MVFCFHKCAIMLIKTPLATKSDYKKLRGKIVRSSILLTLSLVLAQQIMWDFEGAWLINPVNGLFRYREYLKKIQSYMYTSDCII